MIKNNIGKYLSLAGCGLTIFWAGAVGFGYPGVMSTCWQEKFSVTSAQTGMAVTFMLLALACSMFFSGKIHMKAGMSGCILLSAVLYAAAFVILINSKSIYHVYIWGFVANLGCSLVYGPGLTTGQKLFRERRGLISGILNLIFGLSAAVMSPVFQKLLTKYGDAVMNTIVLSAIVITFIMAFICSFIGEKSKTEAAASDKRISENDIKPLDAVRTKQFILIWLVWAFMGAAGISMVSLSKSYSAAIGFEGVGVLTAFNLANGLSRFASGVLSDKIGGRLTGVIAFILAGTGYIIIPHTQSLTAVCICAILVGTGFGTLFTISAPLLTGLFGLKWFGMIFGLIFTAYGLVGGIAGPAVSGLILVKTMNNYTIVFTYLGVFAFIAAVLMAMVTIREK